MDWAAVSVNGARQVLAKVAEAQDNAMDHLVSAASDASLKRLQASLAADSRIAEAEREAAILKGEALEQLHAISNELQGSLEALQETLLKARAELTGAFQPQSPALQVLDRVAQTVSSLKLSGTCPPLWAMDRPAEQISSRNCNIADVMTSPRELQAGRVRLAEPFHTPEQATSNAVAPDQAASNSATRSPSRLKGLWDWLHSPLGRKFVKYAMVSVVSTTVSQSILLITYGVLRLWPAVVCNIVANAVATVPSYYLNRNWTWRKTGRSHVLKEMLPFWASSFAGMGLSILTVDLAANFARSHDLAHMTGSVLVNGANLIAFGTLWFLNFLLYNHVLFSAHRSDKFAVGLVELEEPSEMACALTVK